MRDEDCIPVGARRNKYPLHKNKDLSILPSNLIWVAYDMYTVWVTLGTGGFG